LSKRNAELGDNNGKKKKKILSKAISQERRGRPGIRYHPLTGPNKLGGQKGEGGNLYWRIVQDPKNLFTLYTRLTTKGIPEPTTTEKREDRNAKEVHTRTITG